MAKALSIDPAKRYQTAGEFNEALSRCAHRNGLLMSAPELATELLAACGPTEQWRAEDDDDEDFGYQKRAGTEVYDMADDEDEDDQGPVSIHSLAARAPKEIKGEKSGPTRSGDPRLSRPMTEVGRFQGVELTSIINMIDLGRTGSAIVDLTSAAARFGHA
jgi:hypothetical protein